MSRRMKIALASLFAAVLLAGFYLPALLEQVLRLARSARTEEQARREVTQPPIATPTDVKAKAKIYWASPMALSTLEPVEIELPLSGDPAQRAKQLISALIVQVPGAEQRTLPADVALLEFYLLADGTAVADFSDTLTTATPSGILSEQMAVDSITRTLAANMDAVQRLRILIDGKEAATLAGHIDLSRFFVVRAPAPSAPSKSPGRLTPSPAPGKLAR